MMSLKEYNFSDKLGSGTYGAVYKACRKSGARQVVAIKCVQKSNLTKVETDSIVAEISILKKLKHDFIVEMINFHWDSSYIYIIMEYCGGGDLSKYIKKHGKLPEKICQRFLQQLGSALKFLRSENISHMDLKPQNILITINHPKISGPVLKLADFGFAQTFNSNEIKHAMRGSPLYMAPEMFLGCPYDAKVDLWSVGVILYECLFGKAPYKSETLEELVAKIKSEQPIVIPKGHKITDTCRDLLARCLERDPQRRIEYEEFFNHQFLDLEHMPSEESHLKVKEIIDQAVKIDQDGDLEQAMQLYKSALEYLIPLVLNEKNATKKLAMRKKSDQYIQRAEQIKLELGISSSIDLNSTPTMLSRTDELIKLCRNTPNLKTALEIGQSAELYDHEGQLGIAFDKYQSALGLLIPLLQNEPKGDRKTMLSQEIKRWMSRAETIKDLKALETKSALGADSVDSSQCRIQ